MTKQEKLKMRSEGKRVFKVGLFGYFKGRRVYFSKFGDPETQFSF